MSKYLIIALLSVLVSTNCFGANPSLDKIEESLYGFSYSNDSDTKRVERIEEKVYGKISSGQLQTRIAKLKKDMSADLIGHEIEPKEDSFMTDEDTIVYEKEPASAANMDYPAINELEKTVFQKEFKNQNLKNRLANLEKKVFSKTYDNEDLSTRVDRLKAQIKPQSFANNGMQQQDNDFYTYPADKLAQNYHINQYGTPFDYDAYNRSHSISSNNTNTYNSFQESKPLNLSKIEKQLYNKKFDNQTTSERLTRIESSVFGTSFQNDNDNERMERISSAIQAQKNSKRYDSNKFNQNMATALQIGTLILMVLACIL